MRNPIKYLGVLLAVIVIITSCTPKPTAAPATAAPATAAPATAVPATATTAPVQPTSTPAQKTTVTGLSIGADWLLVSLWDSKTGTKTQLLKDFENKYNIDVKFESLPEDTARQKMMLDFSSHTGQYDIVTMDAWNLGTYASAGYLEPLDDYIANKAAADYFSESDFLPSNMQAGSYGGHVYTLPLYTFGPALIYNKALFAKYNVKVPTNMQELEDAASKLTLDTNGDGKIDVYGITMRARAGEEPTIDTTGMTWAYGGSWFAGNADTVEKIKATKALPTMNSPEFIAGYEEYAKLLQKWGPPESANWSWVECMGAFAQGKAAMHLAAASAYWYTRSIATFDPNDIGIAPAPMGPGGHRMMNYFDLGLAMNKDSKAKDAAWLVTQFITSVEVQRAQAAAGITALPHVSLVMGPELKAKYPTADLQMVLDTLKDAEPNYMPKIPEYTQICDILGTAASEVVAGSKTAKQALDDAQAQVLKLMTDAGYYK